MAFLQSDIGYASGILDPEPIDPGFAPSEIGFVSGTLTNEIVAWVPIGTLTNETLLVTPRYKGQKLMVAGIQHEARADRTPIRVYGTGLVELGGGWWDQVAIVTGRYDGPFFSGSTPPFEYRGQLVFPQWDGEPDNSSSDFEVYEFDPSVPSVDWSLPANRRYSLGVDRGMLYVDGVGVSWSGLTSVNRKSAEGSVFKRYIDGRIFRVGVPLEDYEATVEAFTYPDEFEDCIGEAHMGGGLVAHGQPGRSFDFCYRTLQGDGNHPDNGYKLHLVYGAYARDSGHNHRTMDESPGAETFSFDVYTVPVDVPGLRPTSYFTIDSREVNYAILQNLEKELYGFEGSTPRLPPIDEIRDYLIG